MTERLTPRRLKSLVGKEISISDWMTVDQDRIDAFAGCTDDRQWIHVDPERALQSPLGGTIAHGFLLLSLIPRFLFELPIFRMRSRMIVNYGLNRVRFISPVRSGSRIRNRTTLGALTRKGFRRILLTFANTIEIEGETKPAVTAELLVLIIL
ncbi:MAG: MaoC family dehydratase [Candidatus Aminicenantales bacterium]